MNITSSMVNEFNNKLSSVGCSFKLYIDERTDLSQCEIVPSNTMYIESSIINLTREFYSYLEEFFLIKGIQLNYNASKSVFWSKNQCANIELYKGNIRKVDDLSRIVIPKEVRESLNIQENCLLEFSLKENSVVLTKCDSSIVNDPGNSIDKLKSIVDINKSKSSIIDTLKLEPEELINLYLRAVIDRDALENNTLTAAETAGYWINHAGSHARKEFDNMLINSGIKLNEDTFYSSVDYILRKYGI